MRGAVHLPPPSPLSGMFNDLNRRNFIFYKFDVWLTVHRSSIWNEKPIRCHLVYVYFYLSVAQHVSGHHVPIFRS